MINILLLTSNSITFELINDDSYYTSDYNIYLNDKLIMQNNLNVISIYNLNSNKDYVLKVITNQKTYEKAFKTKNTHFKTYNKLGLDDETSNLQMYLDNLMDDETLIIDDEINITSVFLRDNNKIYLTENAKLIGSTDRLKYPILKASEYLNGYPLGTWEGRSDDSFSSIITGLGVKNVIIYGKGIIDCNAHNSDFWINHREKRIARRPKGIFLHTCMNITLEGITICNTPSWNQHPFYSKDINYYNLNLINPKNSPTTDGIDPESCTNVNIIGNRISVGDDCIAIKSGKIELARIYKTPSSNIVIRNNLMTDGHGGVTLGSENSGGINNVYVSNCVFKNTDRGLRIKSQRTRGNLAIIESINFNNILMDGVLSPFVINAFYKAGNDIDDFRFDRNYLEKTEITPEFKRFHFENIKCLNVAYGLGYFLGLPESKIEEISLKDIIVTYNKNSSKGQMAMTKELEEFKNIGFYVSNVELLRLENVKFVDEPSDKFIINNIDKIIEI